MIHCNVCNKSYYKKQYDSHLNSKKHKNHSAYYNPDKLVGMNTFVYLCEKCNVVIRLNSKYSHEISKIHNAVLI
jgi:hypothetical protein